MPCRVLIEEVGAACVLVGVYVCMVTVELEFHAAGFCVSRLPVAIPLGFERTLHADWRQCFWRVLGLSVALRPSVGVVAFWVPERVLFVAALLGHTRNSSLRP